MSNHIIATARKAAAAAAILVFFAVPALGQSGGGQPIAPELIGLGSLELTVTTRVPAAQRFFNQGLRLLYAFNHAESRRAFREAARLDPTLAMAHWGEAMTWGPNLNAPMSVENGRLAYAAIQAARASARSATTRERGLIDALAHRYAADGAGARPALDAAYAAAMSRLATQFPDDPDVLTLYADAMMNTMPWNYWQKDGKAKPETVPVMAALESAIARNGDHAGAHHYYVHLLEASETPERAEASADRLGSLMPAAGHMVHMPAHIYLRVGRYADAAEANVRAIAADEDYLAQCQTQGLYAVSYYPHNHDFLWTAATLEGRRAVAVEAARQVAAKVPHHHAGAVAWTAHFPVTPMLAYARFGLWKEILLEPAPPKDQPYAQGIWHYARALAFVAQDRFDRAGTELRELDAIIDAGKDLPLLANLRIASRMAAGELAARRGEPGKAIRLLHEAVDVEDTLPYNEPPVWHHPVRQVLGAVLLEAGRASEAERVYRDDLGRVRENGWSLFGLTQSLRAQGKVTEAEMTHARFQKAWSRADISLTSSRIMAPQGTPVAATREH